MPSEMPGRPDRHKGLDDKMQSVTDGNTHTKPEVTVGDDSSLTDDTANPRIRETDNLGDFTPELKEEQNNSDTDIRNEYGQTPTDDTDNSRIRETNNLGDFTPELKEEQNNSDTDIRNEYGQTPSETSESLPSDSSEINSGSGSDSGGDGSDGGAGGGGEI